MKMYPVLLVPTGDLGRNGVFVYIGCPDRADAMRGFDAGFAHASSIAYWPVDSKDVGEWAAKRHPDVQALIDRFMQVFAAAQ